MCSAVCGLAKRVRYILYMCCPRTYVSATTWRSLRGNCHRYRQLPQRLNKTCACGHTRTGSSRASYKSATMVRRKCQICKIHTFNDASHKSPLNIGHMHAVLMQMSFCCLGDGLCLSGLELSKLSALPPQVVENAFRICHQLDQLGPMEVAVSSHETEMVRLGIILVQLANNSLLDEKSLRGYLQALKAKYTAASSNA